MCGRIQFRNGSKITASQLSEALFASYTSLFCLLFFSAHLDRKCLWLKFRRKNIRLSSISRLVRYFSVQVSLCQKLLFLHPLTHNMTTDCSLNYTFNTWKFRPEENMLCTEIVSDIQNNFCKQHVLHMFCKKKSFWQRFTCIKPKKLRNML